jgi:ATP-binding protein involved in chromosome partitioning
MSSNAASALSAAVAQALAPLTDPDTGAPLGRLFAPPRIDGGRVRLQLQLGWPARSRHAALRELVAGALAGLPGVDAVELEVDSRVTAHAVQGGLKPLPGVSNVIAVASGKGGVGKSTTAANLALALAAEGAAVGLLDADIYGPSQQMMMGLQGRPDSTDGQTMEPLLAHGLQVMSIGVLLDPDQPMIWRGPMATQALEQLVRQTRWSGLDYLIVDLPPGTGDIQLTLSQRVPLTGALIVTTPQDIALLDARKGLRMFEKVNVPVLGIVENMAVHVCSNCGHAEHVFGSGGGERMALDFGVELLGSLPLDLRIREQADSGRPSVVAEPDGVAAREYGAIARRLAARIAQRAKDYSSKFPTIKVVDS